jgi:hypothetical protein
MDGLMNNPAVQSGIIPFVVALAVVVLLGKTKPAIMGLAAAAAFIVTVALVTGFSLQPLSSTKKIILMAYAAAVLGLVVDLAGEKLDAYRQYAYGIFALLGIIGVLWVAWPVVSRQSTQNPLIIAIGLSAYVAWMIFSISVLQQKKAQISAAVFATALGTSVVSIVGATALYGQLAAPFAAAAGAWVLFYWLTPQKAVFSASFFLMASVTCASLGAAATIYANLPWLTLVLLGLIPAVVHIPIKQDSAIWLQVLKSYIAALVPAIAAIWYTVQQSADSGYYG